jgi:hypothetical protein
VLKNATDYCIIGFIYYHPTSYPAKVRHIMPMKMLEQVVDEMFRKGWNDHGGSVRLAIIDYVDRLTTSERAPLILQVFNSERRFSKRALADVLPDESIDMLELERAVIKSILLQITFERLRLSEGAHGQVVIGTAPDK